MLNKPTTAPTLPVLDNTALNLAKLELLRTHFPQVLEVDAKGRHVVNAAKLQLALDPAGVKVEEDGYELRWAGKREAYHTAFTPAQTVLNPLPAESKDWDTTGNVLLRGDNLDALRLLRHSYFGKIKLIYIDPPYNTQSDAFIYRDDFSASQSQVLEQLGYDKDNIEYIKNIYGAKTHSGWLSFMYPRLLLAKDLLRDDGVIFISIDDNEQAQLKLLCDEVFGEQSFVSQFLWKRKSTTSNVAGAEVSPLFDYQLCYKKTSEARIKSRVRDKDTRSQPHQDAEGNYRLTVIEKKDAGGYKRDSMKYAILGQLPRTGKRWQIGEKLANELEAKKRFIFDGEKILLKIYDFEEKDTSSAQPNIFLDECGSTESASLYVNEKLLGVSEVFTNPKPAELLEHIIDIVCDKNDLILDFFAGSGTTGEAVMRLNAEDGGTRQFILVQIPQAIDAKKQKEAHQFVTQTLGKPATIFEITAERLRRAGTAIATKHAADLVAAIAKAGGLSLSEDNAPKKPVDTGFRVFDVVPDTDAFILQKSLADATQDDLNFYTDGSPTADNKPVGWVLEPTRADAASTPEASTQNANDKTAQVLHNLLLSEGLPLITQLKEVLPSAVYLAQDVALIVAPVELDVLSDALTALRAAGTPAQHLTVYAPWMRSDNFMQGIKTLAESLGYSADKLRLRG